MTPTVLFTATTAGLPRYGEKRDRHSQTNCFTFSVWSIDGELGGGKSVGMWVLSLIPRPHPSWPQEPDLFPVHGKVLSLNRCIHYKYVRS